MAQDHSGNQSNMFQTVVGHLGLLFRLERRILGLIGSYSIAIGLFSLIVPSPSKNSSTRSPSRSSPSPLSHWLRSWWRACSSSGPSGPPILCSGSPGAPHFARVATAMAQQLPHLRYQGFKPRFANYFMETILTQRAVSVLLVDLINVIVGGAVGMTILVFYHPYFLLYNAILLLGFNVVFFS